jgi:hypothetical protein
MRCASEGHSWLLSREWLFKGEGNLWKFLSGSGLSLEHTDLHHTP